MCQNAQNKQGMGSKWDGHLHLCVRLHSTHLKIPNGESKILMLKLKLILCFQVPYVLVDGSYGWPNIWVECYLWRWPYLPGKWVPILPNLPFNSDTFKAQHWVKHTAWWYYPVVLLSQHVATMVTRAEVIALKLHKPWPLIQVTRPWVSWMRNCIK